jgi:hypothetical protein
MDIYDYMFEEYKKKYYKLNIGENYIFDQLIKNKEIKKNINTIEEGIPLLAKISFFLNKENTTDKYHTYYNLKQAIGRTLSYKIPELNEVKDLSGPIRVIYYENKILNKKIICLGDNHLNGKYICNDKVITIANYIDKLFKNTNINIDLFLEKNIPNKEYLLKKDFHINIPKDVDYNNSQQSKYEDGYLDHLSIFAIRNYKRYINKRIHFTDLRYNELVALIYLTTIDWKKNPTFEEYKNITIKNHNFIISLYKYFQQVLPPDPIDSSLKSELNKELDINIPEYLKKEIDRSAIDVKIKIRDYIFPKIYNYIYCYIYYYKEKEFKPIHLNGIQFIVNAYISDIYTILRIMKNVNTSNDFKNCILYYGDAHLDNINKILLELFDFKLISEKKSISYDISKENNSNDEIDLRCIRDIIPFDKFFNNSY